MFNILEHEIGLHVPPFIIAEISANHNGSLEIAKQTIRAAKNAGASAVKIQSYTQDTMTIDCDKRDFMIEEGLWKGKKLFDLYNLQDFVENLWLQACPFLPVVQTHLGILVNIQVKDLQSFAIRSSRERRRAVVFQLGVKRISSRQRTTYGTRI